MIMRDSFNNRDFQRRTIPCHSIVSCLLIVSLFAVCASYVSGQNSGESGRTTQATTSSAAAARLLREGRAALEANQWKQAAATFTRLLTDYPRDTNAAAAMYWLAFALKMQQKYPEAARELERLIDQFPQSSWVEDARTMQVELAQQLGNQQTLDDALTRKNSEGRLIALQSLLVTNPESALAHAAALLKPDSDSSQAFKESVISLLGRSTWPPAIDFLINVARTQKDVKLRRAAILTLGQPRNEGALNYLGELLAHPEDDQIAEAALFAVSRIRSERGRELLLQAAKNSVSNNVRLSAVTALGRSGDDLVINDLRELYGKESDIEVRKGIIHALSEFNSPRAQAGILEIARTSNDLELRKQAIFWFGRQGDSDQAAGALIHLYDEEQNDDIKQLLLYKLARLKSTPALQKLMDVAQRDASTEMRKRAIFWLNRSNDPEAAKFLRQLRP
jgi:HEAT repeat protein